MSYVPPQCGAEPLVQRLTTAPPLCASVRVSAHPESTALELTVRALRPLLARVASTPTASPSWASGIG